MSYKEDNKKNIETDDMNIRSHLNASLNLNGISVSENLIDRTLAAIKEQAGQKNKEADQTSDAKLGKKIMPWGRYIRGFAGVAAAAIIIAVGYTVIKQMPLGSNEKADADLTDNNELFSAESGPQSTDSTNAGASGADEDTSSDTAEAGESNSSDDTGEEATQFTITAETFADASDEENSSDAENSGNTSEDRGEAIGGEGLSGTEGADAAEEEPDYDVNAREKTAGTQKFSTPQQNTDDNAVLVFRDIFISEPEQAEYVTILDNMNNTSITLTKQADIQAFYLVMDDYEFTATGTDSASDQNYTVEMKSPETQALYTMLVGKSLTVRYTQGDTVMENVYYAVEDTLFRRDIEVFYLKYSK